MRFLFRVYMRTPDPINRWNILVLPTLYIIIPPYIYIKHIDRCKYTSHVYVPIFSNPASPRDLGHIGASETERRRRGKRRSPGDQRKRSAGGDGNDEHQLLMGNWEFIPWNRDLNSLDKNWQWILTIWNSDWMVWNNLRFLQSERSCNMWISASKKAIQPSIVGIKFGEFRGAQPSHRGKCWIYHCTGM